MPSQNKKDPQYKTDKTARDRVVLLAKGGKLVFFVAAAALLGDFFFVQKGMLSNEYALAAVCEKKVKQDPPEKCLDDEVKAMGTKIVNTNSQLALAFFAALGAGANMLARRELKRTKEITRPGV